MKKKNGYAFAFCNTRQKKKKKGHSYAGVAYNMLSQAPKLQIAFIYSIVINALNGT